MSTDTYVRLEWIRPTVNGGASSKKSIACYGDCNDEEGSGGSTGLVLLTMLMLAAMRRYNSLAIYSVVSSRLFALYNKAIE